MPREFKLPDVGEGVAEGEIVQWLVEPGETVTEDQPVAEVETDKALVEVPSPVDGTVRELRAEEGQVVPVGEVIVVFDVEGEGERGESGGSEPEAAGGEATHDPSSEGGRTFAPPHVRRLARELGVDLAAVEGSGPGGRITEDDVRAAAGGEPAGEHDAEPGPEPAVGADAGGGAGDSPTAQAGVEPAGRERTLAAPATRRIADELGVDIDDVPAVEERDGEAFVTEAAVREYADAREAGGATAAAGGAPADGEREAGRRGERPREERIPYRGLRRTIGERMEAAAFTAPHVTHHDLADAAGLVEAREELKARAEERGVRLTYLPFVMKAAVAALEEYPTMNAALDEESEEIVLKNYYNVGFATATDEGLLVPVVEDVDEKGLFQLASEVNELAEKARERSIAREEMRGGTFTITNFGAIGGEYGTPIINHPEVAILGLGSIEKRPYVVDGEVVARETLPVSLSFDHRVNDGATAGRFTNRLLEYLAEPLLLLLE